MDQAEYDQRMAKVHTEYERRLNAIGSPLNANPEGGMEVEEWLMLRVDELDRRLMADAE